jgi:hypothetical protein
MNEDLGGATRGSVLPYLLEAHFYSGGLRIRPLGAMVDRPKWAPNPPDNFVGFRDEFALREGDVVVEFSRFLFAERKITWIGAYHRSIDQVFGDRRNHAGVGVWLLDRAVRQPAALLHGLRLLAEAVAAKGVESVLRDADVFSSEEYLPNYIEPLGKLPPQLGGWPFSDNPYPDTALYYVDESVGRTAWDLVSEHLIRFSVLPAPAGTVSRALTLVRAAQPIPSAAPGETVAPLRRTALAELVGYLPGALVGVAEQNNALYRRMETLTDQQAALERALANEQAIKKRLAEQVTELEMQVAESDILRRLAAIDGSLDTIGHYVRRHDEDLAALVREVRDIRTGAPAAGGHHRFGRRTGPLIPGAPGTAAALKGAPGDRFLPEGVWPAIGQYWWIIASALVVLLAVLAIFELHIV